MVTRGRPAFAAEALDCYRSQTYDDRELIVVDDADEPSFPNKPLEKCVYIRMNERWTIGAKRNLACEFATGDFIAHFDDDDYSAPDRIEDQLARLVADDRLRMIGYNGMIFAEHDGAKAYKYRGGAVIGASLFYSRSFWKENRFPDLQIGEDGHLIGIAARSGALSFSDAWDVLRNQPLMISWLHAKHTTERNIVPDENNWRVCARPEQATDIFGRKVYR